MVSVNGNHLTTLIMKTTKLVPHFRGGAARLIDASLLTQDVAPSVGTTILLQSVLCLL